MTDTLLDRLAINDLIMRERLARDNHDWPAMAASYHEDSVVNVSWFLGTGAEFTARTQANAQGGTLNFHIMTPAVVTVNGDRAIAETPCTLRNFSTTGGVETSMESFVKLLWRARRITSGWLIAGLHCVYVRDMIHAVNPAKVPVLDEARLASYRASYRYVSYNLSNLGLKVHDDLPGVDRPETVIALRAAEAAWLAQG